MKISDLKNKSILILGLGREGKDTLRFLKKVFPEKKIGIADQKLDKNYLESLKDYDVIIKSPGIPFKILPKSSLPKIVTPTDIFFENCQGRIIGITGTKGKSTTTALTYEVLRAGRLKAHLVGNIGKPVLSLLLKSGPKDIFVYELSSHQLYNLKKSPRIAVFLNLYSEHLDYYRNFTEYAKAKANITRYQTRNDYLIYNSNDPLVKKFAKKSKARKIPITGSYYELDQNAAKAVGKLMGISLEKISKAIKGFKGLPHRLELVGKFRGITFYNDALATIPEATIRALDKLGDEVETIFLGGFDRGIDFRHLAERVLKSKIKNVILFPTTGEKIWQEIARIGGKRVIKLFHSFRTDNMPDAVKLAFQHTTRGKIALLSCASTSFSLFRDYKEKGDLFKKYVRLIGRQK